MGSCLYLKFSVQTWTHIWHSHMNYMADESSVFIQVMAFFVFLVNELDGILSAVSDGRYGCR